MTHPVPSKLSIKKESHIEIVWSDGRQGRIDVATLRRQCPCAKCRGERDRARESRLALLPGTSPEPAAIVHAELVGNYALRLLWNDGHEAGIYSFSVLHELMR